MIKRLVVFASGSGSNFKAIYNNIREQKIENAKIELLVSNNPNSGSVSFAKNNSINTFIVNQKTHPNRSTYIKSLNDRLLSCNPHLIILAGYMKLIPKEVVEEFNNKIINIHPGKLPEFGGKGFYGMNVHNAVFRNKETQTGATIHFVDYNYDTGPILMQKKINIKKDKSPAQIAKKVLKIEHEIYPKAVNFFCENKILWEDNKPIIKE